MAATNEFSSSTSIRRRTSPRCQKKSPKGPNTQKSLEIPKKISIALSKLNKTAIRFLKSKLPCCSKSSVKSTGNNKKKAKAGCTIRKHVCSECGKSFTRQQHLTEHTYTHTGEKPYPCQYCDHRFTSKGNLNKHLDIHENRKRFGCSICKRRFTLKKNMVDHERTHSGEKLYECTLCGQKFTKLNSGVRHLRIHTGEKHYECNECLGKFAWKYYLQRHITAKHLNDKTWRPRGCSDAAKPIRPEIVFVDCGNQFGDNFAMEPMTEDSLMDETDFETEVGYAQIIHQFQDSSLL